jgi:hypothetical protein
MRTIAVVLLAFATVAHVADEPVPHRFRDYGL